MYSVIKIIANDQSSNLKTPEIKEIKNEEDYDDNITKFLDKPVPIVKITKNLEKIQLAYKDDETGKKNNQDYIKDTVAFGTLCGVDEDGLIINTYAIFQGNFSGAMLFKKQSEEEKNIVYFQGKIKSIHRKIGVIRSWQRLNERKRYEGQFEQPSRAYLQPSDKVNFEVIKQKNNSEETPLQNLRNFKGFFKGSFHSVEEYSKINLKDTEKTQQLLDRLSKEDGIDIDKHLKDKKIKQQKEKEKNEIIKLKESKQKNTSKIQSKDNKENTASPSNQSANYFVPALVTLQLGKIKEINLEKSAAEISATLKIDIRLNQQIINLLEADQKQYQKKQFQKLSSDKQSQTKKQTIKKPFELTIDFHRGGLMNLPFYNVDGEEQQENVQDQWADIWDGIDLTADWDQEKMIMSYKITSIFTAQIDNSYGIFYSPFNLNIIKIVIDLHAIKLGKNKININCCDLTDSETKNGYQPYTYFSDLSLDKRFQNAGLDEKLFRKHLQRRSKININNFIDQGEFKLADNRITLFPYHKRVLDNSAVRSNKIQWILGFGQKQAQLHYPIIKRIDQSYEQARAQDNKAYQKFQFPYWQFIHVEIPIFKYAVIDIIRIFVPILILSIISLLIFVQENAKDGNGFTTLAKRIASGCSLMIAYVALIPMIRSNLPPTPSVTLIQILIYASTIPNFLAIISNLVTDFSDYEDFFANFKSFSDGLFLASFVISVFSFIILLILMTVFANRSYQSNFFFKNPKQVTVDEARNPNFLRFIQNLKRHRKQYQVTLLNLPKLRKP